eukprot:78823-Chlamydomonas_euryale.AAC.16
MRAHLHDWRDARNEVGGLLPDLGRLVVEPPLDRAADLAQVGLGAPPKRVDDSAEAVEHHVGVVCDLLLERKQDAVDEQLLKARVHVRRTERRHHLVDRLHDHAPVRLALVLEVLHHTRHNVRRADLRTAQRGTQSGGGWRCAKRRKGTLRGDARCSARPGLATRLLQTLRAVPGAALFSHQAEACSKSLRAVPDAALFGHQAEACSKSLRAPGSWCDLQQLRTSPPPPFPQPRRPLLSAHTRPPSTHSAFSAHPSTLHPLSFFALKACSLIVHA